MSDPGEDPEQTPSTTEAEQREEAAVLAKGWLRVGVVSIFAVVLTVVALLQATGLIDLFPFGEDWTFEWLVLVFVAALLVGVELWGWWSDRP